MPSTLSYVCLRTSFYRWILFFFFLKDGMYSTVEFNLHRWENRMSTRMKRSLWNYCENVWIYIFIKIPVDSSIWCHFYWCNVQLKKWITYFPSVCTDFFRWKLLGNIVLELMVCTNVILKALFTSFFRPCWLKLVRLRAWQNRIRHAEKEVFNTIIKISAMLCSFRSSCSKAISTSKRGSNVHSRLLQNLIHKKFQPS